MTMSTRNNNHSDLTVADVMLPLEKTLKNICAHFAQRGAGTHG